MVRHFPGIIAVFAALFTLAARMLGLDEDSRHWLIVPAALACGSLLLWVLLNLRFLASVATSRSARYGVNMLAVAAVVIFIGVMVNVIVTTRGKQWDFTPNRRNSISPLSESVARNLESDVMVTLGIRSGESGQEQDLIFMFQQQLDLYRAVSNRISYQMIDARDAAAVAERGLPQPFEAGTVIVTMNGQNERLEPFNFGDFEEKLTRALVAVSRDEQSTIYVVTARPDEIFEQGGGLGVFEAALENENHRVRPLNLTEQREVPADCTVLVFADLLHRPSEVEMAALTAYLNRGGRALIAIDIDDVLQALSDPALRISPADAEAALGRFDSPFVDYLAQFGIEVGRDIVLEEGIAGISSRGLETSLRPDFSTAGYNRAQDITENLVAPMRFYNARSISRGETPPGVDLFELVNGSPSAFAEDDLYLLVREGETNPLNGPVQSSPPLALLANIETTRTPVTYDPPERGESRGLPATIQEIDPETLIQDMIPDPVSPERNEYSGEERVAPGGAVETEIDDPANEEEIPVARLIVIGDADALRDEVLAPRSFGNRDFILNSINYLAEETDLISIRPIDPINTGFTLSALQMRLFVLGLIVFPLLIAMVGVIVILRRRRLA